MQAVKSQTARAVYRVILKNEQDNVKTDRGKIIFNIGGTVAGMMTVMTEDVEPVYVERVGETEDGEPLYHALTRDELKRLTPEEIQTRLQEGTLFHIWSILICHIIWEHFFL